MVVNSRKSGGVDKGSGYMSLPSEEKKSQAMSPRFLSQKSINMVRKQLQTKQGRIVVGATGFMLLVMLYCVISLIGLGASGTADLRIVVYTAARPISLKRLFDSLSKADYGSSNVHLDIYISPFANKRMGRSPVDPQVKALSDSFTWTYGIKSVTVYPKAVDPTQHALQFALPENSDEHVLFLQDNVEVSPYFWQWLKIAHQTYDKRPDVAGITLGRLRQRKKKKTVTFPVFMSPLVEQMSAYSPNREHWKNFQTWALEFLKKNEQKVKHYKKRKFNLPALHLRYAVHHKDGQTIFGNLNNAKTLASRYSENYSVQGKRDFPMLESKYTGLLQFPADPPVIDAAGQVRYYYEHPDMFPTENQAVEKDKTTSTESTESAESEPTTQIETPPQENEAESDVGVPDESEVMEEASSTAEGGVAFEEGERESEDKYKQSEASEESVSEQDIPTEEEGTELEEEDSSANENGEKRVTRRQIIRSRKKKH